MPATIRVEKKVADLPKIWKTPCFLPNVKVGNCSFSATKILLIVRIDIPYNRSFQSQKNPVNFKS